VSAFAQVTISGLVDAGYNITNYKGKTVTTAGSSNGSATSNFTFAGTEDLGGGLQAKFRWEIDPDLMQTGGRITNTPASGTTSNVTSFLGNGYSYLGLAGGFGEVQFGTLNFATLSANGDGNANFGTAIGSGYRVTSFDAVRAQNSISYETPSFSGVTARYQAVTKNNFQYGTTTDGIGSTATGNSVNQVYGRDGLGEMSLAYANGPLKVRFANLVQSADTGYNNNSATAVLAGTGAKFTLNTLSVNYKTGATELAYFFQNAKSDTLTIGGTTSATVYTQVFNRTTNGVAAAYTTGATKLMANYAIVKLGTDDAITKGSSSPASLVSPVGGQSTTVLGLGAEYAISKRTNLYARYEQDKDNAIVRAITGFGTNAAGTYKATAFGIKHTF
jgi:predicted porin